MNKNGLFFCLRITVLMLLLNLQACQFFPKNQPEKPIDPPSLTATDHFSLKVGSKNITINEESFELNAPVVELEGHSYLPLRFFLDYFQAEQINYDASDRKSVV